MRLAARLNPAAVILGVVGLHFGWFAYFGPQTRWLSLDDDTSGLPIRTYFESQELWLGLSYALSLGFAAFWLGFYRQQRFCSARTLTVGGVTLSGALAVVGCYLLGCCGSPMLAVSRASRLHLDHGSELPLRLKQASRSALSERGIHRWSGQCEPWEFTRGSS